MKNLILLTPEIFLTAVALLIFLGDAFFPNRRRPWLAVCTGALLAALVVYGGFFLHRALPFVSRWGLEPLRVSGAWIEYGHVFGMVAVDSLAIYFKIAVLAAILLILWLSADYYEFDSAPFGVYAGLLLLAAVGMLLLVGATDLILVVIALELIGITSFVMTGFVFQRRSSSEAAIKYFLVGSLSTALFLFGSSYYYGYFGTTSILPLLQGTGNGLNLSLALILILLISGLGFKLAMVPFHMWAPDVYEGAPTPVTAFLSVAPKAAAVGFLLRLFGNHASLGFTPVLAVIAALTMTVGNIGALPQTNLKRLLGYSSIAQMGYILVAVVAGPTLGVFAAMVYTMVYLFMNVGVFAVLITVANTTRSEELLTFEGLSKKSLGLAILMVLFLLSLTGIPPMAGFIGKFSIFASVLTQPHLIWLAVVAVINSVVSLYYYFKIVHHMFFKEASDVAKFNLTPSLISCLAITTGITVVVGLFPNRLLDWVRQLVGS